jgi:hypothetical protein
MGKHQNHFCLLMKSAEPFVKHKKYDIDGTHDDEAGHIPESQEEREQQKEHGGHRQSVEAVFF